MGRPLKRSHRTGLPQCRFEVRNVAELDRIKALAQVYGYPDFRSFAAALFDAVLAADPLDGVVRFGHRFRDLAMNRRNREEPQIDEEAVA